MALEINVIILKKLYFSGAHKKWNTLYIRKRLYSMSTVVFYNFYLKHVLKFLIIQHMAYGRIQNKDFYRFPLKKLDGWELWHRKISITSHTERGGAI